MARSWKDRLGPEKLIVKGDDVRPAGSGGSWRNWFGGGSGFVAGGEFSSTAKRLARAMVLLAFVAIVFCATFPFDFSFQHVTSRFDTSLVQQATAGDSAENVVFFVPLGFALGSALRKRWGPYWVVNVIVVTVIGCVTSLTVETLQCYLGDRDPSLNDVVNNTIGAAAGFGVYRLIGDRLVTIAAHVIDGARHGAGAPGAGAMLVLWLAAACAAPAILGSEAGSLHTWNPNFPMALGNEPRETKWWYGLIYDVSVASRAATREEVDRLFSDKDAPPSAIFGDDLLAWYDVRGEAPYPDVTGKNPPLEWYEAPNTKVAPSTRPSIDAMRAKVLGEAKPASASEGSGRTDFGELSRAATGVNRTSAARATTAPATTRASTRIASTRGGFQPPEIADGKFLMTETPPTALTRGIANSSQFTIVLDLAATRSDLHGPAKVFTISNDGWGLNFTVSQDGTRMFVRLRTGRMESGGAPIFVVDDVFADHAARRLVFTSVGTTFRVYVGSYNWRAQVKVTPETSAVWRVFPRNSWHFRIHDVDDDGFVMAAVYRAMALLPAGMLTAATVNLLRRRKTGERIGIAAAIVVASIVLLETTLALSGGGQSRSVGATIVGVAAALVGVLSVKLRPSRAYEAAPLVQ